jgi:hypothetical protein
LFVCEDDLQLLLLDSKLTYYYLLFLFKQIKDIKDTCYGQAASDTAANSGFNIESFRLSLDSFQQCTLSEKVTYSFVPLFFPVLSVMFFYLIVMLLMHLHFFCCLFSKQVKDSISSMFQDFAVNETDSISSKVQGLLINVLQCLVQNNCLSSQSTEKLNCSSQDENISVGTNMESGDTLKLPSTDTSKNLEENQGWFLYINFSLFLSIFKS